MKMKQKYHIKELFSIILLIALSGLSILNAQDLDQPVSNSTAGTANQTSNSTSNTTDQKNSFLSNDTVTIDSPQKVDRSKVTDRIEDNYFDPVLQAEMEEKYGNGRVKVEIQSIEPEAGPVYGETRVLVRGGPFKDMINVYRHPKCRFGSSKRIVNADYVSCSTSPTPAKEFEKAQPRNETCLQCDDSPETDKAEIVPLTVSLIGDFSDSANSISYRYYATVITITIQSLQPAIHAIQPRLGYKDGETNVTIWGENFLNFDELSVCNFGTQSVKVNFINSTLLYCISPKSDVVGAAIPFSVSFNKQQNTKQDLKYYFYNRPQISMIVPNIGSDTGGYPILLYGQNLMPYTPGHNYTNTTFCQFTNISNVNHPDLKILGKVIDSTHIWCFVPENNGDIMVTNVNVTFNDQQYTEDLAMMYFFKTPIVLDVDPREGPTKGGTEVFVYGDRFNNTGQITCKFGNTTVKGKYISQSQIKCVSPPTDKPGYVPLVVSNGYERYSSKSAKFYYYDTPEIYSFSPLCGPTSGYTQITLYGKNYRSTGFGKTICVFNMTIYMNATIMEPNIIKCDSPPLDSSFVPYDNHAPFYNIGISLDGGRSITNTSTRFMYYRDPIIESLTPNKGQMKGGTLSSLVGSGFKQEAACNVTVRYGAITQNITRVINFTDTQINITSPKSNVPARVIVSIALNGQQYLNDKVFHLNDKMNIFTYYQDVFITDYSPKSGPTIGKTLVKVEGMGFGQFKDQDGNSIIEPMWVRFKDSISGEVIKESMQVFDQSDESFSFTTPPAPLDTKAIMEISYNNHDWQKVIPPNSTFSFLYYNAPRVQELSPAYGPVKNPTGEKIQITGQNFNCPDPDCKDLMVRFGDAKNGIFMKGTKTGPNTVECQIPKYTKPDVLPVEVTFNGVDYTNDNQTYGFFDPFVLDVQPRLIHMRGTTRVRLYGVGFVNTTGTFLKVKFSSLTRGVLNCNGADCVKMAEFIDKSTIESATFPQNIVMYGDKGDNIEFDGMATEACVYGNAYTENGIEIFYYVEPLYGNLSQTQSPSNIEKPIVVKTDFQWHVNDYERFKKYANFTCRFKSTTSDKVIYTKGKMEVLPLGSAEQVLPNNVKCKSPKWGATEPVKFDVSVNGQDFSGDYTYNFIESLDLHRIYPMAGPNEGSTRVQFFGTGFFGKEEMIFRWGVLSTELMIKEQVFQHVWNETYLIASEAEKGNFELKAYKEETYNDKEYYVIKKKDSELFEGQKLTNYFGIAPKLVNWNCTHGGPIYMSLGEKFNLNMSNQTTSMDEALNIAISNTTYYEKTVYQYTHSYIEYYYYQNPVVKKVEPVTGLQRGGTRIEVSGGWFKYKSEYGVIPHCKIGDKVSRAQFHSTVRIVCLSPPNEVVDTPLPVMVSLNGFDFMDTGFRFQYQIQTDLYTMTPTSGEEGTTIFITGSKFAKFQANPKYKCKFSDPDGNKPPAYEYVYYKDNTTIQCNAAKGYGSGPARVQVTFNGEDYSDNNFTFNFIKINGVFPNSGPSDGSGGPILILGDGFKNDPADMNITCKFNGTDYAPTKIEQKIIHCPVPPANRVGETFPTRVDFILQIDSIQNKQSNGFWYYDQIVAEGMEPNIGPAVGNGIINFYVHNLNNSYDYFWANPGCKIGNSQGKGTIVGPVEVQSEGSLIEATLIQCVVEEMELVDKDYYLPATVALNSYSWVPTDFKYVPYGIIDVNPNSGPIQGNTDVIISGKGFNEELQDKAYCRFGVGSSQAIVQADILDYETMLCRSPVGFSYPSYADLPISVPLSITLSDKEQFNPWTESAHRFVFYQPPKLVVVDPDEVEIGVTQSVTVYADEESEFLQPIPNYKDKRPSYDILCRFGRFKDGIGTYVNKTTIKCAVPSIKDDPDSIWRESVTLSIAQNGKDFDEETSDVSVTFVGTGSPLGFWSVILATILIALLILAVLFYCMAILSGKKADKDRSYVIRDQYDQFTSRAYTSGMMGSRGSEAINQ